MYNSSLKIECGLLEKKKKKNVGRAAICLQKWPWDES